jgi:hypothetical protein
MELPKIPSRKGDTPGKKRSATKDSGSNNVDFWGDFENLGLFVRD